MQADNSVAYQYLLCNVQCNRAGALDVSNNSLTGSNDHARVQIAQIEAANGSTYNCYAASTMAVARAAAQDMVDKHPLGATERIVLCKIKQQQQGAASAPVLTHAALPGGVSGRSEDEPASLYTYTVHQHTGTGDKVTPAPYSATDPAPHVTLPKLCGPYYARSMDEARKIALRLETADNSYTVVISRIESSATASVPAVALKPVPAEGMLADNSRHYSYLLLRCMVRPDGKLDVSRRSAEAIVRAAVASYTGTTNSRNVTFARDAASVPEAVADERARASLADTHCLLVCKIKYLSEMSSAAAATAAALPVLRTDSKSYRYVVHRHDKTASGALAIQIASITTEHWSRLRGNGMHLAETVDDANRIVAQLCAAEQRAGNNVSDQMWLVSRVESVLQPCAPLVFRKVCV